MNIRREAIRFCSAGAFVAATDFGVYYLLLRVMPFSIAKGISFTCAGIVAYLFNKFWVFHYGRPVSYLEVGRYVLVNVLALEVNVVTNQSILIVFPRAILAALLVAWAVTGLLTFVFYKWWVFKARTS